MTKSHAIASPLAVGILPERPTDEQLAEFRWQIDRGRITKSLLQALLRGDLVMQAMKREEWIERERSALEGLGVDVDQIAVAWQKGFGVHHRYLPAGLTMRKLLDLCGEAGIKIQSKSIPEGSEELPTEEGVIESNLLDIMRPTDNRHRPFLLNYEEQMAWAKEEGGDGLTSVEETLELIRRAWLEIGRIPFMGGWIRCRNRLGPDWSLGMDWVADFGLNVYSCTLGHTDWSDGALPRKFQKIGN